MRRGGPHPCLPGVSFVILTLHSGMEGETEGDRRRSTAGVGGGGRIERFGDTRGGSHSFTAMICRKGAAHTGCVCVCLLLGRCVLPHIYSAQVHGFPARCYAPVIKRFSTAHQQGLIEAMIAPQPPARPERTPGVSPPTPEDPPSPVGSKCMRCCKCY